MKVYTGLSTLCMLTLISVQTVQEASANLCPSTPCLCTSDKTIDCTGKGLVEIPDFSEIPNGVEVTLLFTDNNLTSVSADAFPGIRSLMIADFSRNSINEINENAFNNTTIWELILDDNLLNGDQIANISRNHLTTLLTLKMDNNLITSLDGPVFHNLAALYTLSMKSNSMKTIAADAFEGVGKLANLDLSENELDSNSLLAVRHLSSMSRLDFHSNSLTKISAGSFTSMDRISYIYFNKNSIQSIEDDVFPPRSEKNLVNILILDLTDNTLTSDSLKAFNGTNVWTLSLINNKLTTVREDVFTGQTLTTLHLYGNPMICDCTATWMQDSIWVGRIDNWLCAAPPSLAGQHFRSVTMESCSESSARIVRFPFGAVLVAFAVAFCLQS